MNRRTRLRRTGILCLHFLRNVAFYRAWNALSAKRRKEQFWTALNGNFIDMAVLDWCKVFGDTKAKHHWAKSVSDQAAFMDGLRDRTGLDAAAFDGYRIELRTYRDKFIAHLDELNNVTIPDLQPALESVRYLYQYLYDIEDDADAYWNAPNNAITFYRENLIIGRRAHQSA